MRPMVSQDLLEVVIDPIELAVRPGNADRLSLGHGLAMLVDARFVEYQRLASEAGWPNIGATVADDGSASGRLLAGIGMQISGSNDAAGRLRDLARDSKSTPDVRVIAAAFAAVAFRDAARPDLALDVLAQVSSTSAAQRAFILLHQSVAERELGDAAVALDSALRAGEIASTIEGQTGPMSVLAAVAARNTTAFAFAASRTDLMQRVTPRSPAFDGIRVAC